MKKLFQLIVLIILTQECYSQKVIESTYLYTSHFAEVMPKGSKCQYNYIHFKNNKFEVTTGYRELTNSRKISFKGKYKFSNDTISIFDKKGNRIGKYLKQPLRLQLIEVVDSSFILFADIANQDEIYQYNLILLKEMYSDSVSSELYIKGLNSHSKEPVKYSIYFIFPKDMPNSVLSDRLKELEQYYSHYDYCTSNQITLLENKYYGPEGYSDLPTLNKKTKKGKGNFKLYFSIDGKLIYARKYRYGTFKNK